MFSVLLIFILQRKNVYVNICGAQTPIIEKICEQKGTIVLFLFTSKENECKIESEKPYGFVAYTL